MSATTRPPPAQTTGDQIRSTVSHCAAARHELHVLHSARSDRDRVCLPTPSLDGYLRVLNKVIPPAPTEEGMKDCPAEATQRRTLAS